MTQSNTSIYLTTYIYTSHRLLSTKLLYHWKDHVVLSFKNVFGKIIADDDQLSWQWAFGWHLTLIMSSDSIVYNLILKWWLRPINRVLIRLQLWRHNKGHITILILTLLIEVHVPDWETEWPYIRVCIFCINMDYTVLVNVILTV